MITFWAEYWRRRLAVLAIRFTIDALYELVLIWKMCVIAVRFADAEIVETIIRIVWTSRLRHRCWCSNVANSEYKKILHGFSCNSNGKFSDDFLKLGLVKTVELLTFNCFNFGFYFWFPSQWIPCDSTLCMFAEMSTISLFYTLSYFEKST